MPSQRFARVERPTEHETLNVVIPRSDESFESISKQERLPVPLG
jgi:hypothetical protein